FDSRPQVAELEFIASGLASEMGRAVVVAVAVVYLAFRLAARRSWVAATLFVLPSLLPGSLPALAMVHSFHARWPLTIADSWIPASLVQAVRFAGVAYLFAAMAHAALPSAERAAALAYPPRRRWWRILFPRALPILLTGVSVVTILILGEVETVHLLGPAGANSPVLALYQMLHFRFDEQSARLSVALVLAVLGVVAVLSRWGRGAR
ncbi:MAG: hypothetical protein KDC38_07615, partial [Planctomycetes bacterium]|nr:hypothetical protein [Planctomycetota bacterium]